MKRKQYEHLADAIKDGQIDSQIAQRHIAEIAQYLTQGKTGYLALSKNGLGPALHGHELPRQESTRWRDSYILHLDGNRSAEELLVQAINDSIPY